MEELIQFVKKWLIDIEAAIVINNHAGKTEASAARGEIYVKEQERVKHLLSSLIALGEVEHFEKQLSRHQDVVTAVLIASLESQREIKEVEIREMNFRQMNDEVIVAKEVLDSIRKQIAELKNK